MVQPITWKTVNAPSNNGTASLLDTARASLNSGLRSFEQIGQDQKALQKANVDAKGDYLTQQFKNQLAQFRSPEELQAAIQSGEVDQMRQQYGAWLDPSTQGMENKLVTEQQQRALADQKYTDQQFELGIRDAVNDLNMRAAKGDVDYVTQQLEANDYGEHEDDILKAAIAAQRGNQDRADTLANRDFTNSERERTLGIRTETKRLDDIVGALYDAKVNNKYQYATDVLAELDNILQSEEFKYLGNTEKAAARQTLNQLMNGSMDAADFDKRRIQTQLDAARSAYKIDNNIFKELEDDYNPAETVNEAFGSGDLKEAIEEVSNWNLDVPVAKWKTDAFTAQTKGLKIPGIDQPVVLPPSVVKMIISTAGDDKESFIPGNNHTFNEVAVKVLTSAGAEDQLKNWDLYQQEKTRLNGELRGLSERRLLGSGTQAQAPVAAPEQGVTQTPEQVLQQAGAASTPVAPVEPTNSGETRAIPGPVETGFSDVDNVAQAYRAGDKPTLRQRTDAQKILGIDAGPGDTLKIRNQAEAAFQDEFNRKPDEAERMLYIYDNAEQFGLDVPRAQPNDPQVAETLQQNIATINQQLEQFGNNPALETRRGQLQKQLKEIEQRLKAESLYTALL